MITVCRSVESFMSLKEQLTYDHEKYSRGHLIHIYNQKYLDNEELNFPCIVEYNLGDDSNGPYFYEYEFHDLAELELSLMEEL